MSGFSTGSRPTVYIVDDDDIMLWTLVQTVETIGVHVQSFRAARDFFQAYRATPCECLICDIRMPEMSGLQVQRELQVRNPTLPIIFVTGYAEVSAAVEAMKQGAFDFVEKPVNGHHLLEKVQAALQLSRERHAERRARETIEARLALLTPKEREIIEYVVAGQSSREISEVLGISVRTVENHRARVMEKLHVSSVVDLVKLFL